MIVTRRFNQTKRLLSWAFAPYSTSGNEDQLHTGTPTRYVPPSGFDYPLDGLRPSLPCRSCFISAALMGFTSSKRSPFTRYHDRFRSRCTHIPFCFALCSPSAVEPDRKVPVSGFSPLRKSLANRNAINKPATGCSPEVPPFQGSFDGKPYLNLHSGSSRSLCQSADRSRQPAHDSEYQSACPSSHPPPRRNAARRTGQPS